MKKKDGGVKQVVKRDTTGTKSVGKVNITTRTPDPVVRKSSVQGKEVPTSRIDSARKANPALSRAIGKPSKGWSGTDTYRDSQADLINSALRKKK